MQESLTKVRSRRQKLIRLSPDVILDLLKVPPEGVLVDGMRIHSVGESVPRMARALRAGLDEFGNIVLVVEDDSFDNLVEGVRIPYMDLRYGETKL